MCSVNEANPSLKYKLQPEHLEAIIERYNFLQSEAFLRDLYVAITAGGFCPSTAELIWLTELANMAHQNANVLHLLPLSVFANGKKNFTMESLRLHAVLSDSSLLREGQYNADLVQAVFKLHGYDRYWMHSCGSFVTISGDGAIYENPRYVSEQGARSKVDWEPNNVVVVDSLEELRLLDPRYSHEIYSLESVLLLTETLSPKQELALV